MKNYWKKIFIAIGGVGGLSLLAIPIVSCSTNFNGTVVTINNNGISITKLQDLTSDNSYKLGTSSTNPPLTKITKGTNTLNFPPSITYNKDKKCPCIISLVTENQTFNAISCVKWNNTTKSWDVYSNNTKVWSQVNESGSTKFTFNLVLVNPPSNTFKKTSYYFCVELNNL